MITFLLFMLIQAMFINGVKESTGEGMILENPARWIREKLGTYWSKPFFGCIRCMSSVYGFITYWPAVLYKFGFEWWQVPVFIIDVFCLVYLTWFLYKRQ